MNDPKVSICIFSYNFALYISQALESVLQQNTNFDFEIVIGDDCSTDNTRAIIAAFQEKHPRKIVLAYSDTNQGGTRNWIQTMNACKGKYIALLDGDDYFIDEYKLQKQVDLMESDDQCVLCFHAVDEVYDNIDGMNKTVRFEKHKFELEDFLSIGWFIRTGSTMFRNGILPTQPPEWVFNFPYRYDTILHVFLGLKGHAIYIDEVMSIWRKHHTGMSGHLLKNTIENVHTEVAMAMQLNRYTGLKYNKVVRKYCSRLYSGLLIYLIRTGLWTRNLKLFTGTIIKANWPYFFSRIKNKIQK